LKSTCESRWNGARSGYEPVNAELLNIFLSDDGDVHARHKRLDAISKQRPTSTTVVREFSFNRFNVTLDFEAKRVSLQNDLTLGPQGEYKPSLEEFEKHSRRANEVNCAIRKNPEWKQRKNA
jgi:hypothetical protein